MPAPAVVEILKGAVLLERGHLETITPTGASILAAAATEFGAMPPLRITATGYGGGSRQHDIPNVLRVVVGEDVSEETVGREGEILMETNIDDLSPG